MRPEACGPIAPPGEASPLRPLALVLPLVLLLGGLCLRRPAGHARARRARIARSIDDLWNGVFLVAVVVFILVEFGTLALVVRFRRRKDDNDDELPAQTHGNTKLEIAWTILPAVMLAVVGFFTLRTLFDINQRDDDALTIQVTGQQWWWEFAYDTDGDGEFTDEDVLTANDLVIPAGADVNLDIGSNDVIHSFWIPALNGKKDAVPGRTHPLHAQRRRARHLRRPVHRVLRPVARATCASGSSPCPPDEFDAWLDDQTRTPACPPSGEAGRRAPSCSPPSARAATWPGASTTTSSRSRATAPSCWCPGNAPDLTHFATRGAFAGAIFDLWVDQDGDEIVEADEIGGELNRGDARGLAAQPARPRSRWTPRHCPSPAARRSAACPTSTCKRNRSTSWSTSSRRSTRSPPYGDRRTPDSTPRAHHRGRTTQPAAGRLHAPAGDHGVEELAHHRRPQAHRHHVRRRRAVLLRARRARGAAHPPPARRPGPEALLGRPLQPAVHHARRDDDLPRRHPAGRRVHELPDAAADRRP